VRTGTVFPNPVTNIETVSETLFEMVDNSFAEPVEIEDGVCIDHRDITNCFSGEPTDASKKSQRNNRWW